MKTPSLSVVLPVYHQADHIENVVRECHAALSEIPIDQELLLVISGRQSDRSLEICSALSEKLGGVRLIECRRPGWGHAVGTGLRAAIGDTLCYANSARTDAGDLLRVVRVALDRPGHVIKANRKIRDSVLRRLGGLLYNLECRLLFDLPYWDLNGTPKAFSRKMRELLTLERDDDLFDLDFMLACQSAGHSVLEVPIYSTRRRSGRSTTELGSAVRLYWGALRMYRERR